MSETAGPQPCPFCGAGAQVCGDSDVGYFVACTAPCGAALGEEYDAAAYPNHDFATADAAVAAWNRRASLPYPPDEGRTHWDECWRERGHHNCAVAKLDALLSVPPAVQQPDASLLRERAEYVALSPNAPGRRLEWEVPLFDAVDALVRTHGGDPDNGWTRRQPHVSAITSAVANAVRIALDAALSIPPAVQPDTLRHP